MSRAGQPQGFPAADAVKAVAAFPRRAPVAEGMASARDGRGVQP
jgi:hypothetical protein